MFERPNSKDVLNNVGLGNGTYLMCESHAHGTQCLYLINVWKSENFRITPIIDSSELTVTGDKDTAILTINSTTVHSLIWAIKIAGTF